MKLSEWFERPETGLTPKELAAALKVTEEAVRLWTKGGRIPRPELMRQIETITGGQVQPNDFFSEAAA